MGSHVDVAVIGGGLCGTAVGYGCSRRGANVVVVEEHTLGGAGATMHSGGMVRAFDHSPSLMQWGLQGVAAWHAWDLPGPSPFTPCGLLYLIAQPNAAAALDAARRYSSPEYPIVALAEKELPSRFPQLHFHDAARMPALAIYEPKGGYCDPRLAARMYAEAIRTHGGSILEHTHVHSIVFEKDAAVLKTLHGLIHADIVVIAAGAGARKLFPSLPLTCKTIPLSRFRHQCPPALCLIDEIAGVYVRPEPPSHFLCGGAAQIEIQSPLDAPPSFEPRIHSTHAGKLSGLLGAGRCDPVSGMMGMDCYTPDYLPLLGPSKDHQRLYLATGFSGRGAKYIPAAANWLSERICARLASPS